MVDIPSTSAKHSTPSRNARSRAARRAASHTLRESGSENPKCLRATDVQPVTAHPPFPRRKEIAMSSSTTQIRWISGVIVVSGLIVTVILGIAAARSRSEISALRKDVLALRQSGGERPEVVREVRTVFRE